MDVKRKVMRCCLYLTKKTSPRPKCFHPRVWEERNSHLFDGKSFSILELIGQNILLVSEKISSSGGDA
jgi:hypothetical protein